MKTITPIILISLLLVSSVSYGHAGRTDSAGCHSDRQSGERHCHGAEHPTTPTDSNRDSNVSDTQAIKGKAEVSDGDTIRIGNAKIRFVGIDAPESKQTCRDKDNQKYNCGNVATSMLIKKIGGREVSCESTGKDRYKRYLGICFVGDTDLNGWMVETGWAMAYRRYSKKYIPQEENAKQNKLGIWSGEFVPPWDWRKGIRLGDE